MIGVGVAVAVGVAVGVIVGVAVGPACAQYLPPLSKGLRQEMSAHPPQTIISLSVPIVV